jgi:hypothetical protein
MVHSIEACFDRSIAARTVEQATFMFDPPFRWFRGEQRREAYQTNDQNAERNEQDFGGPHEILTLSNGCVPSSGSDGKMARLRQMDCDRRPLAENALDPQLAAERLRQLIGQRQAKAKALLSIVCGGDLTKGGHHLFKIFLGDTDPGIANRNLEPFPSPFGAEGDGAAGCCELHRVRQQIEQYLQ